MDNEKGLLEIQISKLLDPRTTPKIALQSLIDTTFTPEKYKRGDYEESFVIFLAYIRFLSANIQGENLEGIWEDIFKKTVKYSQIFPTSEDGLELIRKEYYQGFYPNKTFKKVITSEMYSVGVWINDTLSTTTKCTNPYTRLDLMWLIWICQADFYKYVTWEHVGATFINTICEIKPHRLYPSGDDEVLFGIHPMIYFVRLSNVFGRLDQFVSIDIMKLLTNKKKKNVIDNGILFLSNCIQLNGVFALMAGSINNMQKHMKHIRNCCVFLSENLAHLMNCESVLGRMSHWKQFVFIVRQSPFRCHVIETVRNITAAIINNRMGDSDKTRSLLGLRDKLARDLNVCTKSSNLPRMLISRQLEGPMFVRQHSLLLRNLEIFNQEKVLNLQSEALMFGNYYAHSDISNNSSTSDSDESDIVSDN